MKPAPFDYLRPDGVEAAVASLAEMGGDARLLAGGLSLVPMMNFRLVAPAVVIDVGGIEEIGGIVDHGREIEVGAGVAQAELERWPALAARLPLAAAAFPHVGHYPTRARGTVGGSIAHADPSAELPLVLAVLDGRVRLRSAAGERLVRARAFFEGPLETACREEEMVAATHWPCAAAGEGHAFGEVALRHGDFALAACAAVVGKAGMVVGFGGVAGVPVVREWPRLAGSALDEALAGLSEEIEITDDGEGSAGYRRGLIRTLGARTVARAAAATTDSCQARNEADSEPAAAGSPTSPRTPSPSPGSARHAPSVAPAQLGRPPAAAGGETAPKRVPVGRLRAGGRHRVELVLNGEPCAGEAPPRRLLSDFLRHGFGRRGVHVGCEHGVCGACTVRVDGAPARACLMFAVQVQGRRVDTVEGLARSAGRPEESDGPGGGALSPLQEAFRRHHALQCGYCTPGILMTMTEWLERLALEGRAPDEAEVRAVLSGHLCRCTGYEPIVAAVLETAADAV